jgi:sec-independent protein translocase protein TatA
MGDVAKGIKNFKKGMSEDDSVKPEPSRIDAKRDADVVLDPVVERARDDR